MFYSIFSNRKKSSGENLPRSMDDIAGSVEFVIHRRMNKAIGLSVVWVNYQMLLRETIKCVCKCKL